MAEAILKTGNGKIYHDENNNSVVMEWKGYSTSIQIKRGFELMLKTLVECTSSKVFLDIKDMTMIGMKDQEWLNDDFLPRAKASGLRWVALLKPESHFTKAAVENVSSKLRKNVLTIRIFDDRLEAISWLNSL